MFATTLPVVATKSSLERATRIELAFSAWEAATTRSLLPRNHLINSLKSAKDPIELCEWESVRPESGSGSGPIRG
jgi:hypothetical protein